MKFTVIGHSCLRIETSGPTILVDPWLFGSCYWRSWWHYPTVADPAPEVLEPDFVYLHAPPLRSLPLPVDAPDRPAARTCWCRSSASRPSPRRSAASASTRSWSCRTHRSCSSRRGCGSRRTSTAPTTRCSSSPTATTSSSTSTTARSAGRTLQRILDEFGPPDVRVQELLVRAGLPGALHRRRPGRPRARSPATPTSTTGCAWSTSSGPATACRSAAWSRSSIPRAAGSTSSWWRPGEVVDAFRQQRPRLGHRGGPDGPGRQLELRDRLRARRASTGTPTATSTSRSSRRRSRPRSPTQTRAEAEITLDYATFADYFDGVHARVPARCARPLRAAPPGGVPRRRRRRCRSGCSTSPRRAVYRLSSPPPDTASIVTVDEAVLADAIAKRLCTWCTARCGSACTCGRGAPATTSPSGASWCRGSSGTCRCTRIAPAPARRGHVARRAEWFSSCATPLRGWRAAPRSPSASSG